MLLIILLIVSWIMMGGWGGRENLHIEVDHNTNIMLCSCICSTSFIENSLLDNTA